MGAVYQSYLHYLPLYLQNARRYSVPESAALTAALVAASRAVFILPVPLIGLCLLGCAFIRDRGLQPLKDDDETYRDNTVSVEVENRERIHH